MNEDNEQLSQETNKNDWHSDPVHQTNHDDARPHFEPPAESQQAAVPVQNVQEKTDRPSPGLVILGWLTYAFWGWLILALVWLAYIVGANTIANFPADDIVPYAIAATVVLFPIAFFTDLFYRRHEPVNKTGATMVIMVIHAVIFALFGIGSLITAVFTGLSMIIGTGGASDYQVVGIITGIFATFLYVTAFLRTLNPFKTKKLAFGYAYLMLATTIVLLILGIAGPMVKAVSLRDDRRIEQHLESVQQSVNSYIADNNKLPDNLGGLKLDADAKALVDDGLVEYKKMDAVKPTQLDFEQGTTVTRPSTSSYGAVYRYQLCVNYKEESSDYRSYASYERNSEYETYFSNYSHPAGAVCYKLQNKDNQYY